MELTLIRQILNEMGAKGSGAVCANCGFPKTGKHATGGQYHAARQGVPGKTFCTQKSLALGKQNGYPANPAPNNVFQPSTGGVTPPGPAAAPSQPAQQAAQAPAAAPTPAKQPAASAPNENVKRMIEDKFLEPAGVEPNEYSINNNRLDIHKDYVELDVETIPVPLGVIDGTLELVNENLSSLKNAPTHVKGDFLCQGTAIKDLEGLEIEVDGDVDLAGNTNLVDLTNIHKHFKRINGTLFIEFNGKEKGGISIVKIKGLDRVETHRTEADLAEIFNKHLGSKAQGNLLDLQHELIVAGYRKIARMPRRRPRSTS